jgi:hypothetical protein
MTQRSVKGKMSSNRAVTGFCVPVTITGYQMEDPAPSVSLKDCFSFLVTEVTESSHIYPRA